MTGLTHVDSLGRAHMVDVGGKPLSSRVAVAVGAVLALPATLRLIENGDLAKGDALAAARIAGIMAAKRTAELIPLCHPLGLSAVSLDLQLDADNGRIDITARCAVTGQTGVEMEALTAVSIAALTLYDMMKAVDRGITITDIRLLSKSGGQSGDWERQ